MVKSLVFFTSMVFPVMDNHPYCHTKSI